MSLTGYAAETRLVLKVDVDTRVGLVRGVPRLLELFARLGLKASFFVAMGPDHSGRALKRIFRPGFLRKQLRSGAASSYGPVTMLYGLLLPGPIIAASSPGTIRDCLAAGHEVGLHGWDHVFWHDRLRTLSRPQVRCELVRAAGLFRDITGMDPAAFAAPGWQVTDDALELMVELGFSHVSCCRGHSPFRPLVRGRALPLLELPTTLPTLDEVLCRPEVTEQGAAGMLAGMVRPGRLNVFTLHAEVEGRRYRPVLEEFCRRLQEAGVRFLTLVEAARAEAEHAPAEAVTWGPVAERAYLVAWQASALGRG